LIRPRPRPDSGPDGLKNHRPYVMQGAVIIRAVSGDVKHQAAILALTTSGAFKHNRAQKNVYLFGGAPLLLVIGVGLGQIMHLIRDQPGGLLAWLVKT